jgi:hypothetical protein
LRCHMMRQWKVFVLKPPLEIFVVTSQLFY